VGDTTLPIVWEIRNIKWQESYRWVMGG